MKPVKYGIWDTKDKCWLGNGAESKGPNLYDDEQLARAAATVASRMLKLPLGRIRALPFNEENPKFKDRVEAELSCEAAIASLMGADLVCVRQEDTWTWPKYLGEKTAGVCANCAAPIFFEKQNEPFRKICFQCSMLGKEEA